MSVSPTYDPAMDETLSPQLEGLIPLLAAFEVAAEQGHITRAAQRLGVPQSSLSRRLKTVERTLGVQLFQPAGRRVTLTPQGREFFERTHALVSALDDAVQLVRGNADAEGGLVRFGFPLSLGPVSIPSLLAEFHELAPRVRLHLTQAHGEALANEIRAGRLDLAVMIPSPDTASAKVLGRQQLHLYVAKEHPLSTAGCVDLTDLGNEMFIANPPAFHLRQVLDSCCAEAGFVPHVVFEITEFDTLRELVARGLGVALLPAAERRHPELVRVELSDPRYRNIGLVWADRPNPAVLRLRDHILAKAHVFVHADNPLPESDR